MNYKFKHTEKIVGLFVLIAFLAFVFTLYSIAINRQVFVKKHLYNSVFSDVQGISTKTPVVFKGFMIGELRKFTLNEQNLIDAEFVIFGDYYTKVVENSILRKTINPITGKSTIELIQGPDRQAIAKEFSLIPELNTPEGRLLISKTNLEISGDMLSSIMNNVNLFLHNLNQDNNEDSGSFFRLLYKLANSSEELESAIKSSHIFINKLNRPYQENDGEIFAVINQFNMISLELLKASENLNDLLSHSTELINNYKNPDSLLVKIIDPSSENIIIPINDILLKIYDNLDYIQNIILYLQGQTPEMSNLLIESTNTLGTARKTLEGINNNPLIRRGIPDNIHNKQSTTAPRPLKIDNEKD